MKAVALMIGLLLFFTGCTMREREQALKDRELAITNREQALQLKELSLLEKEAEIKQRVQQLDSTRHDTLTRYNGDLVGRWNVKMTCTETSCNGSAVGDTKLEVWDIYYSRDRIIAKVVDGNKLLRIYTGSYDASQLELTEEVDISPGIPTTQMLVRLTMQDNQTLEGQREIVRIGDCKIVYALKLNKQ